MVRTIKSGDFKSGERKSADLFSIDRNDAGSTTSAIIDTDRRNYSLDFGGITTGDYFEVTDTPLLDIGNEFTLYANVKADSANGGILAGMPDSATLTWSEISNPYSPAVTPRIALPDDADTTHTSGLTTVGSTLAPGGDGTLDVYDIDNTSSNYQFGSTTPDDGAVKVYDGVGGQRITDASHTFSNDIIIENGFFRLRQRNGTKLFIDPWDENDAQYEIIADISNAFTMNFHDADGTPPQNVHATSWNITNISNDEVTVDVTWASGSFSADITIRVFRGVPQAEWDITSIVGGDQFIDIEWFNAASNGDTDNQDWTGGHTGQHVLNWNTDGGYVLLSGQSTQDAWNDAGTNIRLQGQDVGNISFWGALPTDISGSSLTATQQTRADEWIEQMLFQRQIHTTPTYSIEVDGGSVKGTLDGETIYGQTQIQDGTFHHVSFRYDHSLGSDNFELRIDGSQDGTKTATQPAVSTDRLLGGFRAANSFIDGSIDRVLVYDRRLTDSQVSTIESGGTPGDGLILQYELNEGSGTTIVDSSSFPQGRNHLDLENDQYGTVPVDLSGNLEATLMGWVYWESASGNGSNLGNSPAMSNNPTFDFAIFAHDGAIRGWSHPGDPADVGRVTYNIDDITGRWYHVAVVRSNSGGTLELWVDGVQRDTDTVSTIQFDTTDFLFGNKSGVGTSGDPFDGRDDNFVILDRPATEQEILDHMNDHAVPSDALGHFKFDEDTGSTIIDSSGSGNNGTLSGPTYTPNRQDGTITGASYITPLETRRETTSAVDEGTISPVTTTSLSPVTDTTTVDPGVLSSVTASPLTSTVGLSILGSLTTTSASPIDTTVNLTLDGGLTNVTASPIVTDELIDVVEDGSITTVSASPLVASLDLTIKSQITTANVTPLVSSQNAVTTDSGQIVSVRATPVPHDSTSVVSDGSITTATVTTLTATAASSSDEPGSITPVVATAVDGVSTSLATDPGSISTASGSPVTASETSTTDEPGSITTALVSSISAPTTSSTTDPGSISTVTSSPLTPTIDLLLIGSTTSVVGTPLTAQTTSIVDETPSLTTASTTSFTSVETSIAAPPSLLTTVTAATITTDEIVTLSFDDVITSVAATPLISTEDIETSDIGSITTVIASPVAADSTSAGTAQADVVTATMTPRTTHKPLDRPAQRIGDVLAHNVPQRVSEHPHNTSLLSTDLAHNNPERVAELPHNVALVHTEWVRNIIEEAE